VDKIKERDYDLSARNPNIDESVDLPQPAELTARLLERARELQETLANLHDLVSDGEEDS
jgi:type I restriction enzyme M protein